MLSVSVAVPVVVTVAIALARFHFGCKKDGFHSIHIGGHQGISNKNLEEVGEELLDLLLGISLPIKQCTLECTIDYFIMRKNKAGYTAQDAPSTRLKITRDIHTDRRTDRRTDGRTQPLIEMRRRI